MKQLHLQLLVLFLGLAGVSVAQDAFDIFVRQQLMNMNSGTPSNQTLDDSFNIMNRAYAAVENGDWYSAANDLERLAASGSWLETDVNRAGYLLQAAMCAHNAGYSSSGAVGRLLDRAIDKMRYGDNLGGGCEARAVRFRQKLMSGDWPQKFTSTDILAGIYGFIMEIPQAQFNNSINASIARYAAIGGMADAQRGIYESQGRLQERQAKFYAREEYRNATGRTFDPSDPPRYGTAEREQWNAAKRIYDIFD